MNQRCWSTVLGVIVSASSAAAAETAAVQIRSVRQGSSVEGSGMLTETPAGLRVDLKVEQAPPGTHGLHIHQYGDCADAGNKAGGHYNPVGVTHGFLPSDGAAKAHPGDLGNIEVGPEGSGALSLVLPEVSLSAGRYPVAGRAIILHERADDFGQPTGNAGGRIACGPILLTEGAPAR